MIIGTAGHIDHGKSALVKALTGVDPDRLPEEKRRGITIELGFGHLTLEDGQVAGLVDVPGHERFVREMAAGAGGVDVALLVIAADEGVMPQTREHLDICQLLGVRAGVVALTKSDLLPALGDEWLPLLHADLDALTAGTFLEGAERVVVSAHTGQGLPALRRSLTAACAAAGARPADGPAFLPIDRAFTLKGFGTVVTGTLVSGELDEQDMVSVLPGHPGPLRLRGLQSHGRPVRRARAGQRVAANLAGVEAAQLRRGMVLCRAGEVPESRILDVELSVLPSAGRPLRRRERLLLHLGTAQAQVTVALLDRDALAPGQVALGQLRTATPLVALPKQRFILRGFTPVAGRGSTVAGGVVLSVSAPKRRRGGATALEPLRSADAEARVAWLLEQAGPRGLLAGELLARANLGPKVVQRALELLGTRGAVALVDRDKRLYVAAKALDRLRTRLLALVEASPTGASPEGIPKEELRQKLGAELDFRVFSRTLLSLVEAGELEVLREHVRQKGAAAAPSPGEAQVWERLLTELKAGGLAPPRVDELAARAGASEAEVDKLLRRAVSEGLVEKVAEGMYFEGGALRQLRERLVAYLKEHGAITTQAFKDLVGQTRKYVIPLSEYFDRQKVTLRVGEKRVLRRG